MQDNRFFGDSEPGDPAGAQPRANMDASAADSRAFAGNDDLRVLARKIDRFIEVLTRREAQAESLFKELASLPAASDKLVGSLQTQVDLANNLDEVMASLADRNEELSNAVQGVSEAAESQSELLQSVQEVLKTRNQTDTKLLAMLARLGDVLDRAAPNPQQDAAEAVEATARLAKSLAQANQIHVRQARLVQRLSDRVAASEGFVEQSIAQMAELHERLAQMNATGPSAGPAGVDGLIEELRLARQSQEKQMQALAIIQTQLSSAFEQGLDTQERQGRSTRRLLAAVFLVLAGILTVLLVTFWSRA